MTTRTRVLVLLGLAIFALVPRTAAAQPLGTFRWQLQPYCNVITVVVTAVSGIYSLLGTDNNCGAARQASVMGTAFQNPDGTIGLGLNIVGAPGGTPLQIDAAINLPSANGTWRDSTGNSGSFTFTPGAGTGGNPRPVPSAVTANYTRPDNFVFSSTTLVPLSSDGATTISFTLNADTPRVLTFSADCSVDAGPPGQAWVDIDVIHNGVALSPTAGSQDAFCGADESNGFGLYLRPSITLVVPGVAGVNTISIQGRLNNGATEGFIGDSSLVIH